MKKRTDYVTNSSSSSFIITNKTDEPMTARDVIMQLMDKILKDAEDQFDLEPGQSIEIECGDGSDDGAFENFIHDICSSWGMASMYDTSKVDVEYGECHH